MFNYGSGRIYFDKRDGWQYVLSSCTFLRSLLLLMQVSIELEKSHSWFSRFKQIQPYFDPKSSDLYIIRFTMSFLPTLLSSLWKPRSRSLSCFVYSTWHTTKECRAQNKVRWTFDLRGPTFPCMCELFAHTRPMSIDKRRKHLFNFDVGPEFVQSFED